MDVILQQLLAFPPHPLPPSPLSETEYDKQTKSHLHTLSTIPASKLTAGVPGGGDLLDIVDPAINTISYLYILLAYITGSPGKQKSGTISDSFAPGTPLWRRTMEFMERFDQIQIRYTGNELRRLVDLIAMRARMVSHPFAAIAPIRSAILRVDPLGATFTSTHLIFAQLCLEARAYSEALPVLDKDLYYFPTTTNKAAENNIYPHLGSNHESSCTYITSESGVSAKLIYQDHLRYFLYGAMIYMASKDWKHAQFFLEVVITSPVANNASKIQCEAYKKWILVCLLRKGNPLSMPKTTSSHAAKQYHAIGKAYEGLAEVFKTSIEKGESVQRLLDEARMGQQFWVGDCNSGLVRQVLEAFRKFSVLELQKVFAALTVAEITDQTSPAPNDYIETGNYIVYLISTGQLNATISEPSDDPKTWIIRFSDPTSGPLARTEEQQYETLTKQTRKVKVLIDHVREVDRKLSLSKDYIGDAKKRKNEKSGDGGGDQGSAWMVHGDAFDHDEDMMSDL